MPTIKFVRVERDCDHNKAIRRGKYGNPTRGIVYDFDVLIDGEKRAEMRRSNIGKGYRVQDADGRPVDPPMAHYRTGREVDSKAEFLQIVVELLDRGLIPTAAQMAEKRAAEAKAKAEKIEAAKIKQRAYVVEGHAAGMYDVLCQIVDLAGQTSAEALGAIAAGTLRAIDEEAAVAAARIDADPGMFGI